jgi:putative ABC transport system substrate-binding protein
VTVQTLGVREPDDFDTAFAAMTPEMPDGIFMVTDALTALNRKRVFEFAAAHLVPAIYEYEFLARDGGLTAYGPDGKDGASGLPISSTASSKAPNRPICPSSNRRGFAL